MKLILNTTGMVHEMALLEEAKQDGGAPKILGEWTWPASEQREEQLLNQLKAALQQCGITKKELTGIFAVRGAGPFTSLRVGLAFVNALAEGLHLPRETVDTFELLRAKLKLAESNAQSVQNQTVPIVLHAGGQEAALQTESGLEFYSFEKIAQNFKDHPLCFEGTANARQILTDLGAQLIVPETLPSTAQVLQHKILEPQPVSFIEALYLRGPHITVSKDPWKTTNGSRT